MPERPDPIAVSAYYLSASVPGPATVTTRVLRDGGSTATMAADLEQGGDARLTALATYGDLAALPTTCGRQPRSPRCHRRRSASPTRWRPRRCSRLRRCCSASTCASTRPRSAGRSGEPSGNGQLQAWFRLADGRDPDPLSLLMVVDALPPVTFDLGMPGWAPTLELTAHVRALPAPGWLKVRHATRNLAGGMFEEDCEVWDSAGRLVAQSRQLARQPR